MQLLKSIFFFLLAALVTTFLACSGEDGIDGQQGPAGQDGNANVMVSDWFPVEFDEVSGSGEVGRMILRDSDIAEVALTEFFDEGGIFLMYYRDSSGGIHPLPRYILNIGFSVDFVYAVDGNGSGIFIRWQYDGQDITLFESGDFSLRYILIPPAMATLNSMKPWSNASIETNRNV